MLIIESIITVLYLDLNAEKCQIGKNETRMFIIQF